MFISYLISGILRVTRKVFKYFNGIAISTSFVLSSTGVLSVIIALNSIDSESAIVKIDLSLQYCQKLPPVFKYINCHILLNYKFTLHYPNLLHYLPCIIFLLVQSFNVTQFLNITCLFPSSAHIAAVSAPAPAFFYCPLHKYVCVSVRLDFNITVLCLILLLIL